MVVRHGCLDVGKREFPPPRLAPGRTQGRPPHPDGAVSGVEGLAALGVCIVLRRLATVVFPVVAYDPYSPDPCLVIRCSSVLVGLRCGGVLPGYEQNQVDGRKYGVEDVPGRVVGGPRVQAEPLGAIVRVVGLLPLRGTRRVDQRDRCSLSDFGLVEPLLREGVPRWHLIVGSDLADAQVVVCEDFVAALLLNLVMALARAPADERLFVPPVRKGKEPALADQALVADVVDEAFDLL